MSYRLRQTATVLAAILVFKVLGSILYEYRWYFPANFDSLFLNGRRESFVGVYRAAFYTHIISSPIALVLASLLVASGGGRRFRTAHRWAGRLQIILVLAAVVPSGLVMHWDPEWAYRFSAWLSWLIPLAAFELGWRIQAAMKRRNGYNVSSL